MFNHSLVPILMLLCYASAVPTIFRLSIKAVSVTQNHLMSEYEMHACGRIIAALANFKAASDSALTGRMGDPEKIAAQLRQIETSLVYRQQSRLIIQEKTCVDAVSKNPIVRIHPRNGPRTEKNAANYDYKIMTTHKG